MPKHITTIIAWTVGGYFFHSVIMLALTGDPFASLMLIIPGLTFVVDSWMFGTFFDASPIRVMIIVSITLLFSALLFQHLVKSAGPVNASGLSFLAAHFILPFAAAVFVFGEMQITAHKYRSAGIHSVSISPITTIIRSQISEIVTRRHATLSFERSRQSCHYSFRMGGWRMLIPDPQLELDEGGYPSPRQMLDVACDPDWQEKG